MSVELADRPQCPGCRAQLDVISASGRADDLFLCPDCFNTWFAFELAHDEPNERYLDTDD